MMKCEECNHKVFNHHVAGSPRAVYTCGHPDGLCGHPDGLTDEGDCRLDTPDATDDHSQAHGEGRLKRNVNN